MAGEIRVDNTASAVVIHYRRAAPLSAACGAPPGSPWTNLWHQVVCSECERLAPAGTRLRSDRQPGQ